MKHFHQADGASTADILLNAKISDDPNIFRVDLLPRSVQDRIEVARRKGCHLFSIRWPTGESALTLCKPGTSVPTDENIIAAYHECQRMSHLHHERTES
jgi:hypothetical protein